MRAMASKCIGVVLLAVIAGLAGCATQSRELLSDPVRNDELLAELSQQPFRGRWWNFYERASTYQKFELWTLAEADLRTALSLRNVDQRWARTYGLRSAT